MLFNDQAPAYPGSVGNDIEIFSRVAQNPAQIGENVNVLCLSQANEIIEFTGGLTTMPGWTRLPSGNLIKWFTAAVPLAAIGVRSQIYTYNWTVSATIPRFTAVPNIWQVTSVTGAANFDAGAVFISDRNLTALQASIQVDSYNQLSPGFIGGWQAFTVFFLAIGQG
jgi:hypothetical protein